MDVVPLQVERGWGVRLIAATQNPKFRCMGTCSSADFAHDYPHFIFYFQLYFTHKCGTVHPIVWIYINHDHSLYGSISIIIYHHQSSPIIINHQSSSSYLHIYLFLYPTSLYGSISSSSSSSSYVIRHTSYVIHTYIYIYTHTIQWLGGS